MTNEPCGCNNMICHIGQIASNDLISSEDMPVGLYSLLADTDPLVARAAADAAYELIWEHERFECRALKPFIQAAAVHPRWWVRCWAAEEFWHFASFRFRLPNHLLFDPCGAVAACTAWNWVDEEEFSSHSSTVLRLCRKLSQKSPHNAVYVSMVLQKTEKDWHDTDLLRELCQVLLSSNQHLRIKEEMEQILATARTLSPSSLMEVSAEELLLWLIVGKKGVLSVSQLGWIAQNHPDPIARQVALEEMSFQDEDCEQFWLTLAQSMQDEHPAVRLSAAKLAFLRLGPENYSYLIEPLMRLTYDPCLRIVQVAVRSMRECCDVAVETPDPVVVDRLMALLTHPDPLVRINTLYTLQDYHQAPPEVIKVLQDLWAKENQPPVRAAVAEALWWLMPLREWLPVYGVALVTSGRKDWRRLAKKLFSMSELQEAQEAVNLLSSSTAKRFFQRWMQAQRASRKEVGPAA